MESTYLGVLSTNEDFRFLEEWLLYIDNKHNTNYSTENLINNPHSIEIIFNIVNEIKKDGLITKVFGKEVPVIIYDLEYSPYKIEFTKMVNEEHLFNNFLSSVLVKGVNDEE